MARLSSLLEWTCGISVSFFLGDITQKGYEKKRKKLLSPFMQPLMVREDSGEAHQVSIVSVEPQTDVQPSPTPPQSQLADASSSSKNDLKIASFIPVLPVTSATTTTVVSVTSAATPTTTSVERQPTQDDVNLVTVINTEEIDLLPSASASASALAEGESAPAVPPHRDASADPENKSKNGKPRSRNRHKR